MFRCTEALRPRALIIAALAAGICNTTAVAQENEMGPSPAPGQVTSSPEVVIVRPPSRPPTRSTIGAPIQDVSISATVTTDDLNLQSPAGWLELRDRVRQTARQLCARMRFQHPIGTPDEFHCNRRAVEGASDQIDSALGIVRGPPDIENP